MAVRSTPLSSIIVSEHDPKADVNEPITWEEESSTLPPEVQAQLLIGALGGSEIIKISRHDRVQGEQVPYQPITDVDIWAGQYTAKGFLNYVINLKSIARDFSLNISNYYVEDAPDYPSSVFVDQDSNAFNDNQSKDNAAKINTILELSAEETDYVTPNSLSSLYGDQDVPTIQNSYAYNVPDTLVGVLG